MRLFTVRNSVREQNFGDLDSYFCVQEIICIIGCEEGYSLRRGACVHVCVQNRTNNIFKTETLFVFDSNQHHLKKMYTTKSV